MANELEFYGDPNTQSGFTVTAKVYDSTGSQVGGDVSCVEVGSLAIYQGDMPVAIAGEYGVRFFDSGDLLGTGVITWDGTREVSPFMLNIVEASLKVQGVMRLMLSALVGKLAGANTTNVTIRDTSDTKDRIDATVDSSGNRTAVTLDVSD